MLYKQSQLDQDNLTQEELLFTLHGNPLYTIVLTGICGMIMYPLILQLNRPFLNYRFLYWIGLLLCICTMFASLCFLNRTMFYRRGMATKNIFGQRKSILFYDEIERISYIKKKVVSKQGYSTYYQWIIVGNHKGKKICYTFALDDFLWKRQESMDKVEQVMESLEIPIDYGVDENKVKKI